MLLDHEGALGHIKDFCQLEKYNLIRKSVTLTPQEVCCHTFTAGVCPTVYIIQFLKFHDKYFLTLRGILTFNQLKNIKQSC